AHRDRLGAEVERHAGQGRERATAHRAARALAGLEHDDTQPPPGQRVRRDQPADARPDDDGVHRLVGTGTVGTGTAGPGRVVGAGPAHSEWTSSTTRVSTVGSVSGGTP